ncbi:MAG: redoxin domain-containing protein [Bacteroidota bacterium]
MHRHFYKIAFLVLCVTTIGKAQTVSVYKIDQLTQRIYNNSDTTYIVNFWATWCKPCVEEMPEFEKFRNAHLSHPVKVILISMDFIEDLHKKLIPFISKNHYSSEIILLDEINGNDFINKINEHWSGAIPATVVTSKNKSKQLFFEKKVTCELLEEALKN